MSFSEHTNAIRKFSNKLECFQAGRKNGEHLERESETDGECSVSGASLECIIVRPYSQPLLARSCSAQTVLGASQGETRYQHRATTQRPHEGVLSAWRDRTDEIQSMS